MSRTETNSKAYHQTWAAGLIRPNQPDLQTSLITELAEYLGQPVEQVAARCRGAATELATAWQATAPSTPETIAAFYEQTDLYLYDLSWWHALGADESVLIQVKALKAAQAHRAHTILDFGSGIGSLGLLLVQHGLTVTLAEVNPHLNAYARWRFAQRGYSATFLDLCTDPIPANHFDFITAIDVFEHLPTPQTALVVLASALRPGGTLFIHLPSGHDPARPMHLWHDPAILFKHLSAAGLWLAQANGSTLMLRRGQGPRYALKAGLELIPKAQGGVLLSTHPLMAMRLNQPAFNLLASLSGANIRDMRHPAIPPYPPMRPHLEDGAAPSFDTLRSDSEDAGPSKLAPVSLDNGHTAIEATTNQPGLSLAGATAFLDDCAQRRLLVKRPAVPDRHPYVSIIVPAYGRPQETRACLESLLALDYPADRLEIIVIDDASNPPLAPTLADLPIRLMRPQSPTNIGQSAARNLGAGEAKGELLAFIDNDCLANRAWLQTLARYFDDPSLDIVGGRVLTPLAESQVAAFEAVRSPLDMGPLGGEVGPGEVVAYLPTCNLLVRQETLQRLAGFETTMALGEDVDFTWRAIQMGARAYYAPEGEVIHRHRVQLRRLLRRRADYGSSEADLQRRHPAGRRTMVLPGVGIATLIALVMLPVWWPVSIVLLAVVIGAFLIEFNSKHQHLQQVGVSLSTGQVMAAILREHEAGLYHLGANVARYYSLPLLIISLLWPPLLLASAILLLMPPLADYRRLKPRLSLPAFTGLYWLELGAYQLGVWYGCLKWHSFQPLLPKLRLGR